MHVIV